MSNIAKWYREKQSREGTGHLVDEEDILVDETRNFKNRLFGHLARVKGEEERGRCLRNIRYYMFLSNCNLYPEYDGESFRSDITCLTLQKVKLLYWE
jgi:hypothetical protein